MAYDPPTLSDLYERVGRDLRDPSHTTLGLDFLTDYINDGIAELNQLKPHQLRFEVSDIVGLEGLPFSQVWKVEVVRADGYGQQVIPPNNDAVLYQNGWTYYARSLALSQTALRYLAQGFDDNSLILRVYGYTERDPLVADTDIFDGGFEDEQLVRRYVKTLGFQALLADRNLYQQWQTQANNSDVSPTQLTNMASQADAEWRRARSRAYQIRYPSAGA